MCFSKPEGITFQSSLNKNRRLLAEVLECNHERARWWPQDSYAGEYLIVYESMDAYGRYVYNISWDYSLVIKHGMENEPPINDFPSYRHLHSVRIFQPAATHV